MGNLWQDLRYGLRTWCGSPGVTAIAVLSVGLGIGINTAVFSVINALLLRPLPVREPDRLVSVLKRAEGGLPRHGHSYPDYLDYRSNDGLFDAVIAHFPMPLHYGALGEAERIRGEVVSGNYFSVLGVGAALGRTFLPEEDRERDAHPVAVISYRFWQLRLGADPGALGRALTLNGHPCTVVGVAPPGFLGIDAGPAPDVWVPLSMQRTLNPGSDSLDERGSRWLYVTARLKPGVTVEQAAPQIEGQSHRLEQQYPNTNKSITATVQAAGRMSPRDRSRVVPVLALLLGVVVMILLIACANVANLLLARAAARQKEMGVRLALGAGRGRLARQLLTESALLGLASGGLGLLLALWAPDLLHWIASKQIGAVSLDFSPDGRVFAFTLLVSLGTGILFGLAPALRASRTNVVSTLKEEGLLAARGLLKSRIRDSLAVAQVALSLVLLIGAGLLVRAAFDAQGIDPGFQTTNVLALPLDLTLYGYQAAPGRALLEDLVERARSQPGVAAASLAATVPLGGSYMGTAITLDGIVAGWSGREERLGFNIVGPGYFETLGIPLLGGREFDRRDHAGAPLVAVVNETLARRLWPGENPLGKRFRMGKRTLEVAGVARTTMYRDLGETQQLHFYLPLGQSPRLEAVFAGSCCGRSEGGSSCHSRSDSNARP